MDSILNGTALDRDCYNNSESPAETIIKSRIKGNFSKMLQQQNNTILGLVTCVIDMNKTLLDINQQLCQSNKNSPNEDMMKSMMIASFIEGQKKQSEKEYENKYGHISPELARELEHSTSMGVEPPNTRKLTEEEIHGQQVRQQFTQQSKMQAELQRRQQEWEQSVGFPSSNPIPNSEFPPSSVEQALNNNSSSTSNDVLYNSLSKMKNPLESLGITGPAGKEFARVLIHNITGNKELFDSIATGLSKKFSEYKEQSKNPPTKTVEEILGPKNKLLSSTEELNKAAQEIANKSLNKTDEEQLAQLAKRIEAHDKELKEQEIKNFLESGSEIDI